MRRILRLSEHPSAVPVLARAYEAEWPDWYCDLGHAAADLQSRCNTERLPLALVALEDDLPIGTLALSGDDTYGDPDFRPTVIGLWVALAHRRTGIATALLRAACGEARALGFPRLHAATAGSQALFRRNGWTCVGTAEWRDAALTLFRTDL